jgi:capsular exopolysaccharide synthesis family protein
VNTYTSVKLQERGLHLAAKLKATLRQSDRVILFTGAAEREGVSTVSAQVSIALAHIGEGPVILVDANVRSPFVHKGFQVERSPGLVEQIEQKAGTEGTIHDLQNPGISILSAGGASPDYLRLFSSSAFSSLMQSLRERFRFVIIDSAPFFHDAGTTLLIRETDAVVIVVGAGKRRQSEVLDLKHALEGVKANVLGFVLFTCRSA